MSSVTRSRLVVFGCGYVGSAVALQARARGLAVTALTRNRETAAALAAEGIATVVADLADHGWHGDIAGGATYVLNTVSAGAGGLDGYRRSYVDGMRSVLRWASARGAVDTLVYTSSTSVYPQGGGAMVDETVAHDDVSERGEILLEAERLLLENAAAMGGEHGAAVADVAPRVSAGMPLRPPSSKLRGTGTPRGHRPFDRCFIFRLAGIYGPARHYLLDQVRAGSVAGRGDHRMNLIHRDDVCAAIWAAFGAAPALRGGVFNVADDRPSPKAEVVAWLAARLGCAMPAFTGQPAGSRRAVTPDRVISNAKIKRELGWHPRFADYRAGYENILSQPAE